jgi:hypothetical protein
MASFSIENKKIFVFLLPITLDDNNNNNFATRLPGKKTYWFMPQVYFLFS